MNRFIYSFIVLASISTILSCKNSVQQKQISWADGDSEDNKLIISNIKTQEKPFEIIYNGHRIQFFDQTVNGRKIQNTFVKKNYDQNKNLKSAEASYFESQGSKIKNIKITTSDIDKVNTALKSYLNQNSLLKKYKNVTTENLFQVQHGQLKPVLSAMYELSDGTVWQALLDSNYKILSNLRQGSGFTDSLVHIYRFGPVQSSLTEALLKGLDSTSPLLSQNIFVDNESNKKIVQILPEMKFDPKDDRFDQLQVYYYLDYIQTWMRKNLNIKFSDKLTAVVNVGFPEKTNTAFYFQNKIRFGHGDDVTYSLIASDPSIVFHESFHALIDGLARLPFDEEGGSINEGFADFFTCVALNRPYLAESSYLKAPYKRSLLDVIHLDEKTGGLYHDSLIISGLLWNINQKLGQEKSLKLATEILSKLTPISQLNDFNRVAIQIIQSDLSDEDQQTANAILKARGFNYE